MNRHWQTRLGDHCEFVNGGTPSKANAAFWNGDIPWITSADIGDGLVFDARSKITREAVSKSATNLVPNGTILLVSRTGVGKVAQAPHELAFSQDITAVIPKSSSLDARYLLRFLETRRPAFERNARGATIKGITREVIESQEIPLPPLDEQRRIAAILDKADALRQKRKRTIALLDGLAQSIFLEMFGGYRLWPEAPLAEAVAPDTMVTYGIVQAGEEFQGGVPYIRTGDIQNGRIRLDGLRHTDPAIAAKFQRSKVRAGEIVISIRATVGTVAIVPTELDGANLTQGTARISPGPRTDATYLLHYLRSDRVQNWIKRQVKGATFLEITLGRLRELVVELPPLAVQQQFASVISGIERNIKAAVVSRDAVDSLFASLQHRAFSGQL